MLALVHQELGPVFQSGIDHRQGSLVVVAELDPLPELGGQMRTLDGLHVEIESALLRVGAYGGVAGVGKRAGLPVAETGHIVLISAEVSLFGCPTCAVRGSSSQKAGR